MSDQKFADRAALLGGQAALALGWRPWEFWQSTPAELQMVMSAFSPTTEQSLDRAALDELMQQHPDNSHDEIAGA